MRILPTLLAFSLLLVTSATFAQRYATANGAWSGAIWATTPNGVAGSAATPTATDDVYTNGRNITVTTNANCRNLFISYNISNSLSLGSLRTVTITGTLSGYDDTNLTEEFPVTNVFTFGSGSSLIFTGVNVQPQYSPYVIYFWDSSVPLGRATFNFGAGVTRGLILPIDFGALARVSTGILSMDPGATLSGSAATLDISTGASIVTSDQIGSFNSITVSGTITTTSGINATSLTVNSGGLISTSGVITTTNTTITGTVTTSNAINTGTNFTMNSTGILNTSYIGGSGWFSGSAPGTINLDPTSTVNFSANGAQTIPITTYGHLTLSGSGTKTASGTGSLTFAGNINNSSSSVTFSPTQDVLFTGSAATQTISGTGAINFASGVEIDKTSGSVNLNRSVTIAGGLTVSSGTLNLGSQTVTLSNGNITNTGTFNPGTSTFIINGATQISGTGVGFNNLTIGASGSFVAPSGSLTISGNLLNNGSLNSFNANSGTLLFNGTADQSISGSFTLNNITCSNSGTNGVGVSGTINLLGVLSLSSGKFDADGIGGTSGVLIVRSTDEGSGGRIAALGTPSNFTGNVTVERYVTAPEDYRYLAIPVIGADVGMLQDDIAVTGNFSNPTTPAQNANVVNQTSASIFTFNGATQAFAAVGSGAATSATSLSNTTGYTVWTYNSSDVVIDVTGTIGKGNINLSGLAAGQYNLVPNPYPSAIDWDLITTTGFSNSMYLTTGQGTFATYTKGGGIGVNHPNNNWGGEIALGQSFYVQSTSATLLPLTEAAKTSTYDFVRENEAVDYFKIKLQGPNNSDELAIAFRDGATRQLDEAFDAPKKLNPAGLANLSSYIESPSVDFAINVLPKIDCNETVKLKMSQVVAGQHSISFNSLEKLLLGYQLKLKDNFTGQEKAVSEGFVYDFSVDLTDPATTADGRFEVLLGSPRVDPGYEFGLTSSYDCSSEFVKVTFANAQTGVNYLFKLNDQSLHEPVQAIGSNDVVLIPKAQLQYGSNKLNLTASSVCGAHIYNQAITVNLYELDEITSVTPASICDSGSTTLSAQGASSTGSYRWYESQNAIEPLANQFSSSLLTGNLSESKTFYVSAVNSYGCESLNRTAVTATVEARKEITSAVGASICGKGELTLQASGAPANGSYRWYESEQGGSAIQGAVNARFTTPMLENSKTYYVTAVTSLGCESNVRVPVVATVDALPAVSIAVDGMDLSVNPGNNSIQWFKDGVALEGETSSELTIRETGEYSVMLTNSLGCTSSSEGMEFIVLGVEDAATKNGFTVYPNPTEGLITISGNDFENIQISFWNANGKQISDAVITDRSEKILKADITKYPKGLYLINIKKNNTVVQFKTIKK
jgi:hypothetical protein